MTARILQWIVLVVVLGGLAAMSIQNVSSASSYSTYDSGANGYLAFYDVLRDEGVSLERAGQPLGLEIAKARVWIVTPAYVDYTVLEYDRNEIKSLQAFVKSGGRVVVFITAPSDRKQIVKAWNFTPLFLNVKDFTNSALDRSPQNLARAYDAIADRGPALVDERIHGYDTSRSLWDALPLPVHVAAYLVFLAIIIALVAGNVRFAPAIVRDPPPDRDSSSYITSMASLLRRARAPHVERKEPL